jgi:predicted nucleotidyltransferase
VTLAKHIYACRFSLYVEMMRVDAALERSIFNTVRYFDIFGMPVTAVQIWRTLIITEAGAGVRWGGRHIWSLAAVQRALRVSPWLSQHVASAWGYFSLKHPAGKNVAEVQRAVRRRLARHVLAQRKWRILRRAARLLARLPLVRMIGVSGSLALWNTRAQSDLDLFIIVRRGRIWTARLLLLLATQLLGRRRKYWEGQAPDKVCLNHYITDDALAMSPDTRNVYTAMLYVQVVPLAGMPMYWRWREANESWLRRWLMYPPALRLRPRSYVRVGAAGRAVRRWLEGILLEPLGGSFERFAERIQRGAIVEHASRRQGWPRRWGRIKLSDVELAFHPDSEEPAVLRRFGQDPEQGSLL